MTANEKARRKGRAQTKSPAGTDVRIRWGKGSGSVKVWADDVKAGARRAERSPENRRAWGMGTSE